MKKHKTAIIVYTCYFVVFVITIAITLPEQKLWDKDIKKGEKYLYCISWDNENPYANYSTDTIIITGVTDNYIQYQRIGTDYYLNCTYKQIKRYIKPIDTK